MTENILRFNKKQRYVVFDTETEGLNLVKSRPWQIAWLVAEGDKIISRTDRFIQWPALNLSEGLPELRGFPRRNTRENVERPIKSGKNFLKTFLTKTI